MKPCAWTLYSCSLLNASDTESNSRSNSFKLNTVKLGPFRKATFIGGWGGGGRVKGGEGAGVGASTHFDPVNNLVFRCSTVFELSSAVT